MAYNAIITKLEDVREHPNADRLQLATVLGTTVVVGTEAKTGDVGVYFPADGQLSEEYCIENDLFPRYEEVDGVRTKVGGGMFDPRNRRVRAQRLRQVRSDGFFTGLNTLAYTGASLDDLYIGYQFDTLNDKSICNKYVTPRTKQKGAPGVKSKKIKNKMFYEHVDTKQFAYNKHTLEAGDIVYLTEKVHGTSSRISNVFFEPEPRKWWNPKTWRNKGRWGILHGTRRVVIGGAKDDGGFYGSHNFRFAATQAWENNLLKGETVYGEIVGWAGDAQIMPNHDTSSLKKDKFLKELFGGKIPDQMTYSYNCIPGTLDVYVYRITQTNIDGESIDLTWNQVKRRCVELGIKHVLDYPDVQPMVIPELDMSKDFDVAKEEQTKELVNAVAAHEDMLSMIDPSHISEGVAVRVETASGEVKFFKSKSFWFKVMEGIIKDNEDYVDMEESS